MSLQPDNGADFSLFEAEEKIIHDVEEFLSRLNENRGMANVLNHYAPGKLEGLIKEYKKLYKSTKRMVRMSDKRENEIKKLNAQMKEKNELLGILSSKLARYLSPQLAETILSGKQDVKLESTRKKLTIFFSDIVGFSDFADRLESEDLTDHLNYYMEEMTTIALNHGATIDKYIGDAIMIFFGDPTTKGVQNDALQCVKMAIAMKKRLKELREEESDRDNRFYTIRMGIHTGYCTVGNFGSDARMDYTIIGNSVNIASRLETSAAVNEILISSETYQLIKDEIFCEECGEMRLKGLSHPIMTYRAIDLHPNMKEQKHIFDTYIFGGNTRIFINANRQSEEELHQTITQMESILDKLKKTIGGRPPKT